MLIDFLKQLKTAFLLLVLFSFLTGFVYPALVTGVAQILFPWTANGSLVMRDNVVLGSTLIGQSFNSPDYFWGRPSATPPYPYDGVHSSGSNMGPSNPHFLRIVKARIDNLQLADAKHALIPVDLVTASGSGLDPEISPYAAFYQAPRIAKASHIAESVIMQLITSHIKPRFLGILGEPRVNVLELNIALDALRRVHGRAAT